MDTGEQRDLGAFLQARRAEVSPAQVGLPEGRSRRVPGLRREELAQLAGVSVDYYTRLEQGRARQPSTQVLDAIAGALGLDDTARAHLRRLCGGGRPPKPRRYPTEVRPELLTLLTAISDYPAMIGNHRMDVLAGNPLAEVLYGGPLRGRNLARELFLDPDATDFYPEFQSCTRDTVGQLRLAAGEHPDDKELTELIGELVIHSKRFGRLWSRADVRARSHGPKRFRHPMVGVITLHQERLVLPDGSGQELITLTAEPGSADHDTLQLLASLADELQIQPVELREGGIHRDHPAAPGERERRQIGIHPELG